MKNQNYFFSKFFAIIFKLPLIIVFFSSPIYAGESWQIKNLQGTAKIAQKIMENIRDVVDHGDLADDQFYAIKVGVSMAGGEIRHLKGYDDLQYLHSMPYPGSAKYHDWTVQQFYYGSVPKYFDQSFGRDSGYVRPYVKAFLENGKIGVLASIIFDTNRLCISEDVVRKIFNKDGKYSELRGMFKAEYSVANINEIYVDVTSTYLKSRRCVRYVNFSQNFHTED